MLTVALPDAGRDVGVGVYHQRLDLVYGEFMPYDAQETDEIRRCTVVNVVDTKNTSLGNGAVLAFSVCKPGDNFCKQQGRRFAANNLLRKLRDNAIYSKRDRKVIFQAVCPEYPQR